jgi:hypothetical protein
MISIMIPMSGTRNPTPDRSHNHSLPTRRTTIMELNLAQVGRQLAAQVEAMV